ncbi:MAG: hypothetical protein RLW62_14635 [Gammaproteobacteria bacterium]
MNLIPHTGIDSLRLGTRREDVREQLGAPDRKSRDRHEDGEISEIWIYRLMRLELSFDSEHDYRLSHITSYHPYTLLRGFNPIGMAPKLLLQKYPHLDLDVELAPGESYYTDHVLDLTFGIARGKVVSVTVFPEYEANGEVVRWPQSAP